MFVPAAMSEVDIFVFEDDIEKVAEAVASRGVIHLLDVNSLGKWAKDIATEWTSSVNAYANQERRIVELLRWLGIEESHRVCEGRLDPAHDHVVIEKELQEIERNTRRLRDRESALNRKIEHLELVSKSMENLAPLSLSISDLRQLKHLHMVAGTMPSENLRRLEASLFRIPYTIIPLHRYDGRVLVFAFCAKEHVPILDRALESAFLDPLALPEEYGGTAQEGLEQVRRDTEKAQAELAALQKERQQLADELGPRLLVALPRIRRDRIIADAMTHFGHRQHVYLIAGWVPKDKVAMLRAAVEEAAEGRVTFEENSPYMPGTRVQVPTLLRNARLLRPMESIVGTYGIPGYREIDPTPLVSITFVLMFGIMFGDLGHGLVVAALGALLAFRLVPKLAKQAGIGTILLACGISSSIFGMLYGSFFGLEDVIPHIWLSPMHDIPTLLGASVAFGAVILNIGFFCHLVTAVREKTFVKALFDKNGVAGLLLYWGLGGAVISIATGHSLPGWLFGGIMLPVLALFFAEPLTNLVKGKRPLMPGNLLEALVQAFFELFEALISYVSNTLSYVRLGAFAVAHAGLSTAIFLIADMVAPVGSGGVVRLIVIGLGTMLVIGFEGLIVAIQTLRLEYYELFGKFFKGDGVPFRPLTLPSMECQPADNLERSVS